MFVHSLRKRIGAQVSGLFCNEDEDLQAVIDEYCDTGITRIELRFEQRRFQSAQYYIDHMNQAYTTFTNSFAMKICSFSSHWNAVVEQIQDCLLFIEETSGEYYIGWYKNNAH